jgi:acyl carrier protein
MDRAHIEAKLRDFIDQSILDGQGADLSVSTPLFEFGILDSFALFTVIGFIADEWKLNMQLERLRTEDFESIATIAALVHAELALPQEG